LRRRAPVREKRRKIRAVVADARNKKAARNAAALQKMGVLLGFRKLLCSDYYNCIHLTSYADMFFHTHRGCLARNANAKSLAGSVLQFPKCGLRY
jgi:hypothetical protein